MTSAPGLSIEPFAHRTPRPHAAYKAEFLDRILSLRPASVLDVGAGDGDLLLALRAGGCARTIGLEVDAEAVARLRAQGLDGLEGVGEALPLGDQAVDVVVLRYTAHHLADLGRGLREAARVARRAVLVLDPWYDLSIPSQRTAKAYDSWSKAVDRRLGMVHNDCPTAWELAAPFLECGGFGIEIRHRLLLNALDPAVVASEASVQLARLGRRDAKLAGDLEVLLADIAREGITDDGAVLMIATRDRGSSDVRAAAV